MIYVAHLDNVSVSAAITLVQVNAPSTAILKIHEAWVNFNSVVSAAIRVQLLRVTTAGTGSSFTPIQLRGRTLAAGASASNNHSAEGTAGDILRQEIANYLTGFRYLPTPEAAIVVPPSGRIALKLPTAPGAAVNITAGIIWEEIG